MPRIVSLFDFTGNWSQPYVDAGYEVIRVDIQHGIDIYDWTPVKAHGVLAAPPCTEFARSGTRWWPAKDADGRTADAVHLVRRTLEVIKACEPTWWALENPPGRLVTLVPELGRRSYSYHPYDFGEPHRKLTYLWGDFNADLQKTPVEPVGHRPGQPDAWYSKVGGKSLKTKNYRSATPPGFARAFFVANP